ncbi:MAG: peptidoglycan DD-metalloendopeptidase family protein, partial [Spirochaetota bacterium]
MSFIPLTNYQIQQIRKYLHCFLLTALTVFIIGNILKPFIYPPLKVDASNYILKDGFPLFTSQKEYISILKKYPHDMGTKISYHIMQKGESYWDVSQRNGITIDTLMATNPALISLIADEGVEVAIPSHDGVLVACDNSLDAERMARRLGRKGEALGHFLPGVFDFLSMDDIRFAFIKNVRPVLVNNHLEGLFEIKKSYNVPCAGQLASMYGIRLDPFLHTPDFHEGIDIRAPYGTPIRPIKEGMVIQTGWRGGYGLCIQIVHPDGYSSIYGHCSVIKVEKGALVSKDDIIGFIGSTGRSTGPHLHFEMNQHGGNVNPLF